MGDGTWIYADLTGGQFNSRIYPLKNGTVLNPEIKEWRQYTGLKDKNGKEIYEGDIIFGQHKIIGDWKSRVYLLPTGVWFGGARFEDVEDFEVIGNIYENPELLKH